MTRGPVDLPASDLRRDMIAWRHAFHRYPELCSAEHRTADRIADLLQEFGLEVHRGIGCTGVVGVLQRGNATRCLGLRADMDALPVSEVKGVAHRSRNDVTMHACGHDGHMAVLLGAARHLSESGTFQGRAVFIFQPAEEHGQRAGAMLDDGLIDRFGIEEVYGMHNIPGMAVGAFATRVGADHRQRGAVRDRDRPQSGHAALPHIGVHAILVGSEIVGALQSIVSRKLNPGLNGVVSVTGFTTDGKRNVLPGRAVLSGDARALTPDINASIEAKMRQIVAGICMAHGVRAEVRYDTIFAPTINAAAPAGAALRAARRLFGDGAVDGNCPPNLFSVDFAHFAVARPVCFVLMGNGTEGAYARPLHSADYDFNDDALVAGASFWIALAEQQSGAADR